MKRPFKLQVIENFRRRFGFVLGVKLQAELREDILARPDNHDLGALVVEKVGRPDWNETAPLKTFLQLLGEANVTCLVQSGAGWGGRFRVFDCDDVTAFL